MGYDDWKAREPDPGRYDGRRQETRETYVCGACRWEGEEGFHSDVLSGRVFCDTCWRRRERERLALESSDVA